MRTVLRALKVTYLTADPRSLGLFRIAFGLVLLSDLLRRYEQLDCWYTNGGLLPNHTLLWRPAAGHVFSLFFVASSRTEAAIGFAICAVVYLLYTVGFRTRVLQVLVLICRVSLNSRLAILENGGDMVVNLLCVFTLALPLGRRFSVDARLAARRGAAADSKGVASLAMLGLILQFAAIYFFNAASKVGDAWTSGMAVHYALHQDKFVTPLGVWMREQLSTGTLELLTWATLAVEWAGFALLVTPVFARQARLIAVLILPLLHLGFALGLHLGTFSWAMMSFFALLLMRPHWDAMGRVWDRNASRRWACALRSVGAGAGALLDRLTAAARPSASPASTAAAPQRRARRVGWLRVGWLSEASIGLLIVAIATEALNDNTSVPQWLRVPQPAWAKAVIEYPRLLQGWRMFAPDPPFTDSMIYVAATTAAGERVDPYNIVASRHDYPAGETVPERMGQSQFFTMYSDRIAQPQYAAYRQAFSEWLLAYPRRTGQPSDCLTAFEVYAVVDRTPPPGDAGRPTPLQRTRFMQYTAPPGACPKLRSDQAVAAARPAVQAPRRALFMPRADRAHREAEDPLPLGGGPSAARRVP